MLSLVLLLFVMIRVSWSRCFVDWFFGWIMWSRFRWFGDWTWRLIQMLSTWWKWIFLFFFIRIGILSFFNLFRLWSTCSGSSLFCKLNHMYNCLITYMYGTYLFNNIFAGWVVFNSFFESFIYWTIHNITAERMLLMYILLIMSLIFVAYNPFVCRMYTLQEWWHFIYMSFF